MIFHDRIAVAVDDPGQLVEEWLDWEQAAARLALTAPSGRWSVSELAAHWQFADSSHFIRAFKKRYGQTPTEYARSTKAANR